MYPLMFVLLCALLAKADCGRYLQVTFNQQIKTNDIGFGRKLTPDLETSPDLKFDFEVTFKKPKCCPVIFFYPVHPDYYFTNEFLTTRCLEGHEGKTLVDWVALSPFYIYLKPDVPHVSCVEQGENYVCTGTRSLRLGMEREWYLHLGYRCNHTQSLDLTIKSEFVINAPLQCHESTHKGSCLKQLNYTSLGFPNMLGQQSEGEARLFERFIFMIPLCHQHAEKHLCRALFQECTSGGKLYLPCRQMCEYVIEGCEKVLTAWGTIPRCDFLPDKNIDDCFYQAVECPELKPPGNGSVMFTGLSLHDLAHFSCNNGFDLIGPENKTCWFTGKWTEGVVHCRRKNETITSTPENTESHTTLITVITVFVSLLFVLIIICILVHKWLKLLLVYSYYGNEYFNRWTDERMSKIFLSYSSHDREEITDYFLPDMKKELPKAWEILTFDESFTPGENLVDTVHEHVWNSHAVIVFLTDNFINSQWCEYEFSQAHTRQASDTDFRLIIIMRNAQTEEHQLNLDKLPDHLKIYVTTRVYLCMTETLFWFKLRRAITE